MKMVLFCSGLGMHMRERLITDPRDGCWARMDTFKEKQDLKGVFGRGRARPGRCGIINTRLTSDCV